MRIITTTPTEGFGASGFGHLRSAASDIYEESRSDAPLLLAQREESTTPARKYTWRDAAAGAAPAIESKVDWARLVLELERTRTEAATTTALLATPEPVLRVGTLVALTLGAAVMLTGWTKVGLVLVGSGVVDVGLRQLSPGYRRLRLNDVGLV